MGAWKVSSQCWLWSFCQYFHLFKREELLWWLCRIFILKTESGIFNRISAQFMDIWRGEDSKIKSLNTCSSCSWMSVLCQHNVQLAHLWTLKTLSWSSSSSFQSEECEAATGIDGSETPFSGLTPIARFGSKTYANGTKWNFMEETVPEFAEGSPSGQDGILKTNGSVEEIIPTLSIKTKFQSHVVSGKIAKCTWI